MLKYGILVNENEATLYVLYDKMHGIMSKVHAWLFSGEHIWIFTFTFKFAIACPCIGDCE